MPILLMATAALAAPWSVPVQGAMSGADGAPLSGTVSARISIHDSAGGAEVWGQDHVLSFAGGAFSAILEHDGSVIADFGERPAWWISVTPAGGPASSPVRVTAAPLANWASNAGRLQGHTWSEAFSDQRPPGWANLTGIPADIADGDASLTVSQARTGIEAGALTLAGALQAAGVTSTAGVSGTTGTFTGALQAAGVTTTANLSGTDATFTGTLQAAGITSTAGVSGTTGTFTGALSAASINAGSGAITTTGDLSVRALTASQTVRTGSSGGAVCDSSRQGAIEFANGQFRGCDGSAWRVLGGGTAGPTTRAFWEFEEGTGTTAADSSGNGQTGTFPGSGIGWTTSGKSGNALNCLGSTSAAFLTVPSTDTLRPREAVTMEAWVYLNNTTGYQTVIGKSGSYLMGVNGGSLQVAIQTAGGPGWNWMGNGYVAPTTWTHVAGTFDGYAVRTYVNHVLTSVTLLSGTINQNANPVTICGRGDIATEQLNGRVDSLRVSAEAKTYPQPSFVGTYKRTFGASGELVTPRNAWTPVPGISMPFVKRSATSVLRIDVSDTMRTAYPCMYGYVYYEILIDGNPLNAYTGGGDGDRCFFALHANSGTNNDYHIPTHAQCHIEGVGLGAHTLTARYYNAQTNTCTQAYFGWERSQRSTSVQEILLPL